MFSRQVFVLLWYIACDMWKSRYAWGNKKRNDIFFSYFLPTFLSFFFYIFYFIFDCKCARVCVCYTRVFQTFLYSLFLNALSFLFIYLFFSRSYVLWISEQIFLHSVLVFCLFRSRFDIFGAIVICTLIVVALLMLFAGWWCCCCWSSVAYCCFCLPICPPGFVGCACEFTRMAYYTTNTNGQCNVHTCTCKQGSFAAFLPKYNRANRKVIKTCVIYHF